MRRDVGTEVAGDVERDNDEGESLWELMTR
jgi:hypothetical protein